MPQSILETPLVALCRRYSWLEDFFTAHEIDLSKFADCTFRQTAAALSDVFFDDLGTDRNRFVSDFRHFVEQMQGLIHADSSALKLVTVLPGKDKDGVPEPEGVTLRVGEVTAVVGPTGSGKSRLLEDIECAQGDTPTGRSIRLDGKVPTDEIRFAVEGRLIAQLSQNMSFAMDLSVEDFITLHAESRMIPDIGNTVSTIFDAANALAGESFRRTQPVTQLSGGQSRALMIADTALLSAAPIVLIDEIENAGVDRVKALGLLVSAQKIVIISTHDPLLALSAHQRIVIRNGGILRVLLTDDEGRCTLTRLKKMDETLSSLRTQLRNGERTSLEDDASS